MTRKKSVWGFAPAVGLAVTLAATRAAASAQSAGAEPQSTPGQAAPAAREQPLQEVVVTGVRQSLQSAQAIKEDAIQIVDSIVAEDIGKLPDNNVAEALQRVTGIQVRRDAGEAFQVLIRGLPNTQTLINGRETFTGTSRIVSLQDISAELLAGVDVYKTRTPDQLEGGVAGLIDIRLRRPFDFNGFTLAGGARAIDSDQADKWSGLGSLLVSNRWQTGIGEVGAMLAVSYQNRRYQDERLFNYILDPNIDPATGTPIAVPLTSGAIYNPGDRSRPALNMALQWQASDNLLVHFDGIFTGYRNKFENNYFIGIPNAGTLQSVVLVPGITVPGTTDDELPRTPVSSLVSENNFTLTSTQAYRDHTNSYQYALGANWNGEGPMSISTELTYNVSTFKSRSIIVDTSFNAPQYAESFNQGGAPHIEITGVDYTDAANFNLTTLFDNNLRQNGEQLAWNGDMLYELHAGPLRSFKAGARFARREAHALATNASPIAAPTPIPASSIPGFGDLSPSGILSSDRDFGISHWYGADADYLRNHVDTIRQLFGRPAGDPPYDPAQQFDDVEKNTAAYGQVSYGFDAGQYPVDGVLGVRVVNLDETLRGFQSINDGPLTSVERNKSRVDVLPSLNARLKLREDLFWRFFAGKVLTRPDFSQLNPQVSLSFPGNTNVGTGEGGNAALDPIRATNFDMSFEWYFARTGLLSGTVFYRDLEGYIQTYVQTETIDGLSYDISRPRNTGRGELKGIEIGYTQFFDFLPPALQGFGAQLNYTYVDGTTEGVDPATLVITQHQPLVNVSKNSYNAIALFERTRYSARLAYNWRSRYVDSYNAAGLQPSTIIVKPTSRLDFSASYAPTEHFTFTFDVTNITDDLYQDYFGDASYYPRDSRTYDRTYELGARFRF